MMNTTRKRFWPLSLAATLAVIGVLAVAVALTALPGATFAQDPPPPPALPGTSPTPTRDPNAPPAPPAIPGQTASPTPAPTTETPAPTPTATQAPQPTATQPPAPQPTATQPPATQPPATQPPATATPAPTAAPTPTATPDPNRPTTVGTIGDRELDQESVEIELSGYFSVEAEDAELTYEAESSDVRVATVTVSDSTLTITNRRRPNTEKTAVITVWANNGELRSEPQTFTVRAEGLSLAGRHSIKYEGLRDSPQIEVDVTPGFAPTRPDQFDNDVEFTGNGTEYRHVAVIWSDLLKPQEFRFSVKIVSAAGEQLGEDATVNVIMTPSRDGLRGGTIGLDSPADPIANLIGLLTVRSTDKDSERTFGVEFKCEEVGDRLDIDIEDEELRLVLEAAIVCVGPEGPAPTVTQPDCYQIVADSDEEYPASGNPQDPWWSVRDQWWDDNRDRTTGLRNTSAGRYTIQAVVNEPHLQLTVTACEEGPVYIRFLDADMESFGSDIDEVEENAGADIVGLDSQGKLELNLGGDDGPGPNYGPVDPGPQDADWAHWYDHFTVETSTNADGEVVESLAGNPGTYYQGKFRFFTPCPTLDHQFYVQVYEKKGKYLRTQERISCGVDPLQPSNLSVTTYNDRPGEALLRWRPVPNADAHLVVVIDTAARRVVATPTTVSHLGTLITGLENAKEYSFAVLAQRGQGATATYTVGLINQTMSWSN